jgi:hypothetical protein
MKCAKLEEEEDHHTEAMKPVKCRISEVASLDNRAILGTFPGILNATIIVCII